MTNSKRPRGHHSPFGAEWAWALTQPSLEAAEGGGGVLQGDGRPHRAQRPSDEGRAWTADSNGSRGRQKGLRLQAWTADSDGPRGRQAVRLHEGLGPDFNRHRGRPAGGQAQVAGADDQLVQVKRSPLALLRRRGMGG